MVKTALQFVILYVLMVLAQVIVFNHICLFGYAVPLVFIYLIIKLPMTMSINWVLTVSFLLGLTIDIFSDTQGMNSLACTLLGVLRRPVLRLYFPREEEMSMPMPSFRSLGVAVYLKYVFSISLIYCALFFMIESFSLFNPMRLLIKIASSALLTFIIIIAIDSLTFRRNEKRL
ncbi:MAG: rod shape-determining protein MreD [Bacteroidales bacterium]|nr:rod shape-determining protein MreD [Bacteroidales bacterium]